MKIEIIIHADPQLVALLERLVEALQDVAVVIAPLTGYRVRHEQEKGYPSTT